MAFEALHACICIQKNITKLYKEIGTGRVFGRNEIMGNPWMFQIDSRKFAK